MGRDKNKPKSWEVISKLELTVGDQLDSSGFATASIS